MSTDRYMIGEFTLDVSQGCLRRGDIEIALRPKSFALLQHLITHAGRLVTKDELLSKIWPNVIVGRGSPTVCAISKTVAVLKRGMISSVTSPVAASVAVCLNGEGAKIVMPVSLRRTCRPSFCHAV